MKLLYEKLISNEIDIICKYCSSYLIMKIKANFTSRMSERVARQQPTAVDIVDVKNSAVFAFFLLPESDTAGVRCHFFEVFIFHDPPADFVEIKISHDINFLSSFNWFHSAEFNCATFHFIPIREAFFFLFFCISTDRSFPANFCSTFRESSTSPAPP